MGPSSKKLHKDKIWDFGTKLGLFEDHFYTFLGLLVVIFIKMPQNLQKANFALKPCSRDVLCKIETFWGPFLDVYIKMKNIPDIYWPGVFQYQDTNRTTDGSYTWISFIDQPTRHRLYQRHAHIDHSNLFCSNSSLQHSVTPQVRVRNLGLA